MAWVTAVVQVQSLAQELHAMGVTRKKKWVFFVLLGPRQRHMEVPRLGVELEL